MTDEELVTFSASFREGILDGGQSEMMCFAVAAPLSTLLHLHGVENNLMKSDLGERNHFWLRLSDGRALDPTADQFNDSRFPPMPPVYLGPPTALHLDGTAKGRGAA